MSSLFGEEVKRLRNSLGLSQAQLAEKSGMTQAHLSTLESGKRDGSALAADAYLRLCDALGVRCEHFRQFMPSAAEPAKKPIRPRKAVDPAAVEKKPKKK
jgi:transcriptional regulator with XRE-family HTH domain